jgi:hypothetical protein
MSLIVQGMCDVQPICPFYIISGIVLVWTVSFYVSEELKYKKIVDKLIQLEEGHYDLTEVIVAINEKVYKMNSKWKRKYVGLKNKITGSPEHETPSTIDFVDACNLHLLKCLNV